MCDKKILCIETERLKIVALNPEQLELWTNDILQLEQELKCSYQAEPIEGFFKEIVKKQVEKTYKDRKNYMWHSFWLIIRKSDDIVVGTIDFKNVPNLKGEVEIGYGLGKEFEHYGYMTETVCAMCKWALQQDGVKYIIAETELDGFASQRILLRCGFTQYMRNQTIWWKLMK